MTVIHKPAIVIAELGELGRLPDRGIINAGGVAGPHFTIGGLPVIMADGSASDGSGQVIALGSDVKGYEHIQTLASTLWAVHHAKGTKRIQITIWDSSDELLFADIVKIVDIDTVTIHFNTAVNGRAILMMF